MTRLLLWFGVACVLLAAVGSISVMAAEAQPTAEAAEEATLAQAELEVRKAELRARYAEENLADVQARVDVGTAGREVLRAAERDLEEAKLALLQTRLRAQEWESQRVSLDVKETALEDALRLLFKDTPYSYVLSPEIGRLALDPLTIRLKEVDLQTAVRVICDTYDLLYEKDGSIYYFFPRSDVVTIGGRTVPLLGTLQVPYGAELGVSSSAAPGEVSRTMIVTQSGQFPVGGPGPGLDLAARAQEKSIDLQLEDMPIREAMARLAQTADMEIVVHEAVPEDIRIRAKVYRVSAYRLLHEIADQAGLTVAQERVVEVIDPEGHVTRVDHQLDEGGLSGRAWVKKREFSIFHIVPKPELTVSGPGVTPRGGGGGGGRHGGGGGSGGGGRGGEQ
jgi:type II secretory pathway component GspD/PulD (secretin)